MTVPFTTQSLQDALTAKLALNFGTEPGEATDQEMLKACALVLRDVMALRGVQTAKETKKEQKKQVHYLSLEFLMGRSLMKNAYNLGVLPELKEALGNLGFKSGDLFELEPADPYTDEDLNYNNEDSRVSQEYADESLRDVELVSDTVENWDSYDTVFIGYPIWWGIAAWPVDTFVEANDFTGKTVIPFATSASSGLGESGQLLAELAGTGDWQEGMRFRSSVSEGDVQEWLDSLSLS